MVWSSLFNFDAMTLQMTAAERDSARLGSAELSTAPRRPYGLTQRPTPSPDFRRAGERG
jgi:hypothetical protein